MDNTESDLPSIDSIAQAESSHAPAEASAAQADSSEPCIYQYLDYRAFLKDRFRWLQSRDPGYSQRRLARVAGFANPGFFNEVIQGRRKLSSAATERMGTGLCLKPSETEFLRALVAYNEADDSAEKEVALRKVEFRRNRFFFHRLDQKQSKYYLDFNYPLVRAAIEACDFRGDYQMLGDFLRPPMPAANVKRYVRDLCEWGLVEQDREGRYVVTHSYLEPPEEMKDALVRLQQAWLTQSIHLLNTMPASERHASSALLTIGENTYKSILTLVEKMREEILALVRADKSSERVVQLNIQVFPRGGGKRVRTLPPVMKKRPGAVLGNPPQVALAASSSAPLGPRPPSLTVTRAPSVPQGPSGQALSYAGNTGA
jgi:uncharacterized protein (TIGR02147 family)